MGYLLWSMIGGALGCDGCGRGDVLARLVLMQGEGVTRDFAQSEGQWKPAELDAAFRLGDGVRAGPSSEAVLALADESRLRVEPNTQIRFMAGAAGASREDAERILVETGSAVLTVGDAPMRLQTALGVATIQRGSRVRVSRQGDETHYTVEVGSARFVNAQNEEVEVTAGNRFEVGIGQATLQPVGVDETNAEDAEQGVAGDAGAEPTAGDELDDVMGEPGLEQYSLRLPAGGTATIHTPSVPVAVGVDVGELCDEGALVSIAFPIERYHGRGVVGIPVDTGSRRYKVRCLDGDQVRSRVVAGGRIRVLRDSGRRRLPREAPTTEISADGREYNVYYQNQRPNVVVRWPNAPQADVYTLHVDGERRRVDGPQHTFRSGELRDGTHRIHFEAAGRRSRETTVVVRFDNAAPKAAVTAPSQHAFDSGETVRVEGVALPGWQVSAQNGTIQLHDDHRFEGQVTTTAAQPDVALRLTHRRRGTHFYIRHSRRAR